MATMTSLKHEMIDRRARLKAIVVFEIYNNFLILHFRINFALKEMIVQDKIDTNKKALTLKLYTCKE